MVGTNGVIKPHPTCTVTYTGCSLMVIHAPEQKRTKWKISVQNVITTADIPLICPT